MSGLDWNLAALSASASAVAALIAVAVGLRRRRRNQTTRGADALPERRIEVVAIDESKDNPEKAHHMISGARTCAREGALDYSGKEIQPFHEHR